MNDLDENTSQSPHINCRDIVVCCSVVQYLLTEGFSFFLVEEVYHLWRHVFWSSQSILFEVLEKEAGSVVYQFEGVSFHVV